MHFIINLICNKKLTKYEKQAASFSVSKFCQQTLEVSTEDSISALGLLFTYFFNLFTQWLGQDHPFWHLLPNLVKLVSYKQRNNLEYNNSVLQWLSEFHDFQKFSFEANYVVLAEFSQFLLSTEIELM